ncbi:MAG: hypothetical protein DRI77_09175 [Chloroflexi bacterium]|nr:MAG: hypothetical protein B6I34_11485 [Anaerolineaceae bacterium 4572_32.1]RLC95998.1 MAG: hypothetical protein DRI77_09175 [Chloroflexota bacterium]
MNKLTTKERILLVIGAATLIIALALTGGMLYILTSASESTLRWWAGLATVALPIASLAAYFLGRMEARGHLAGLTQGIEAVSEAARKTTDVASNVADIRISTAQRVKRTPVVQQMFLPPAVADRGGVILPPLQADGDIDV